MLVHALVSQASNVWKTLQLRNVEYEDFVACRPRLRSQVAKTINDAISQFIRPND